MSPTKNKTESGEQFLERRLHGVLIAADSVSGDGEQQGYGEFVVTLEGGVVDVRLGDRKGTIWTVPLARIEEALKTLKGWQR